MKAPKEERNTQQQRNGTLTSTIISFGAICTKTLSERESDCHHVFRHEIWLIFLWELKCFTENGFYCNIYFFGDRKNWGKTQIRCQCLFAFLLHSNDFCSLFLLFLVNIGSDKSHYCWRTTRKCARVFAVFRSESFRITRRKQPQHSQENDPNFKSFFYMHKK